MRAAGLLALALAAHAGADETLEARVARLERKVAQLRAEPAESIRAEARLAVVDDVTAGHDGSFFIASADGDRSLALSGWMQVRFGASDNEDSTEHGFDFRRVRLRASGHIVDPSIEYVIGTSFGSSGAATLSDAYIAWHAADHARLRIGRFRTPFDREWSTSAKRQLLNDRSLVAKSLGRSRAIGVSLDVECEDTWFAISLMDEYGATLGADSAVGVVRAEWMPLGERRTFRDFTSMPDDEAGVLLGGGLFWEDSEDPGSIVGEAYGWTADASYEHGGANATVIVIGRHMDPDLGASSTPWGVVAQGGVFVTSDVEVFAQYAWGDGDDGAADLSTITGGATVYLDGHDLKWTTDVGYGLNPVSSTWASSSSLWRTDAAGDDGQVVVRSQLQMVF